MAPKRGRKWAEKGSQMRVSRHSRSCVGEKAVLTGRRRGKNQTQGMASLGMPAQEFGTREEAAGSRSQNQGQGNTP